MMSYQRFCSFFFEKYILKNIVQNYRISLILLSPELGVCAELYLSLRTGSNSKIDLKKSDLYAYRLSKIKMDLAHKLLV